MIPYGTSGARRRHRAFSSFIWTRLLRSGWGSKVRERGAAAVVAPKPCLGIDLDEPNSTRVVVDTNAQKKVTVCENG